MLRFFFFYIVDTKNSFRGPQTQKHWSVMCYAKENMETNTLLSPFLLCFSHVCSYLHCVFNEFSSKVFL